MKPLKAVLLDVDGTLVDSNEAHAQAWLEVFEQNGFEVSLSQLRELIGKGGDKVIPEVAKVSADSADGKRLSHERSALFKRVYLPQIQPFPKVDALLRRLTGAGLRLVVASSARADELQALLEICGAVPFVHGRTSSDDARHSKPDPDIVQIALQRAECSNGEAILLGDTPYDVQAATRAGVRAVGLRCGGHSDAGLRGAVAVYDDPADLLQHFETSVFA